MRFLVCIAIVVSTVDIATSLVPDVYEFCNALLEHSGGTEPGVECEQKCPQGPPGQRGPEGKRGPPGPRGNNGTSGMLKAELDTVHSKLNFLIKNNQDNLVAVCGLGMRSGAIRDNAITTTTQWDANWGGNKARIDNPTSCWHARPSNVDQYIQIDLGAPTVIAGVVTRGRPTSASQWVGSYKISCVNDPDPLTWCMENGEQKVFAANSDQNTMVANFLPTPLTCRYVRLHPQTWNLNICMRMELLGKNCLPLMP